MYERKFSKKACIAWMVAAVAALGLGQALGLFLTLGTESSGTSAAEPEPVVITGTVIRQEQVVYAPFPGFWETGLDAQRVYAGQTLFTLKSQHESAAEVRLLSGALEASRLALPRRRENIHRAVGDMQQEDTAVERLMAQVLGEGACSEAALQAAQESLAAGSTAVQTVSAEVGGIFVPVTDGLETYLTPEKPEIDWADLPERPRDELALGRIVTSEAWYFYGDFPECLTAGTKLRVFLLNGIFTEAVLTVVEAKTEGDGGCRALCSCDTNIADVAKLRNLSVKILS